MVIILLSSTTCTTERPFVVTTMIKTLVEFALISLFTVSVSVCVNVYNVMCLCITMCLCVVCVCDFTCDL